MRILAIETSCDETAVALVDCKGGLKGPRFKVLKNFVSSQIKIHRPFGGVVPTLAKREHIKNLPKILGQLMSYAKATVSEFKIRKNSQTHKLINSIDSIAVTVGPGLEPALWAGIEFAKDLAKKINKPLIGTNHMEGHLYSNWLPKRSAFGVKRLGTRKPLTAKPYTLNPRIEFPAIALVVSGGHTILLKMDSLTKWKKLGETRDDAAGEAFDKVARLLGLPYPGGPEIQKVAKKGNPQAINFPRPMSKDKNYEFSFSGLKTSVLYYFRDLNTDKIHGEHSRKHAIVFPGEENALALGLARPSDSLPARPARRFSQKSAADFEAIIPDIAASFQQAVIDVLVGKTMRAAKSFGAESVLLCGGVSANKLLQETLKKESEKIGSRFFVPDFEYNTDNAAMIAAAAYIQKLKNKKLRLVAQSNLNL